MIKKIYIFIFTFCFTGLFSQTGGDNVFSFLELTNSARMASLGGGQISLSDEDLNLVYHNPSLLNESMSNQLALNYVNYLDDLNYGYVSYAGIHKKHGVFGAGIHFINYGKFEYADETGNRNGNTFSGSDFTLNLYHSRPVFDSTFRVGGAFKIINSFLESYNSFALALDGGITYYNPNSLFTAAFVFKNLGFQLNSYSATSGQEPLPFELQLGISQKLRYAPFRISLLLRNLEKPDLRYDSPLDEEKTTSLDDEVPKENKFGNFADNVARHLIIGLEFLPGEKFHVRLGYNYKRQQELKIEEKLGLAGFSWGFGLKIYKFNISYGWARYHLSSVSNTFSVSINLSDFSKKY